MRFLADESCDFAVVRALRSAGHEVVAVAEIAPRSEDTEVIELAAREGRLLLTEDKDFGQLVYAHPHPNAGVILLRFPARAHSRLPEVVVDLVGKRADQLVGHFVVVGPGRVRIRPRPGT
ncbi:MAG: DUF5615 family PIN-like protein [Chloroflexi bacterium]|nr:DUF5615 family PIN-like protein [Chloroflexota bacterium]